VGASVNADRQLPGRRQGPVLHTEYPDNLFTLFGRYYDVTAHETISQLCPPRHCTPAAGNPQQSGLRGVVGDSARVLKQILQPYDAAFDPALFVDQTRPRQELDPRPKDTAAADFRFKQAGRNQPARFDDFLHGLRPSERPALHFLHLLLPHQPWRYLPSGNEYNFKTFGGAFRSDRLPAPVVELAHQQHLLQLAYTDGLVGQVIGKLKAQHMWDKSLVVMGADHGEGWTPGEPSRALGQRNAPDLMWVPQFIKAPGQDNGTVDDRNWEQVDLLPTIADLAGIPATAALDDRRSFRELRPGSGRLPALVSGRLTSAPPPGATVLVAVNGRIGGGSEPFSERPGEPAVGFAVLTPDFLWKPGGGHRQLRLYILNRSGGVPHLQPVSVPVE
jgi:hypothetical protein